MTYITSSLSNPSSPERAAPRTEALHATRATPWEPRGARVSRALIGVAGAALVGGLAIAGVLLTPSRQVPHHPANDQVAATPAQPSAQGPQGQASPQPQAGQTADQMAAQSQREPAAAGTSTTPAAPSSTTTTNASPAQNAQPGSTGDTPSPAPKPGSDQ